MPDIPKWRRYLRFWRQDPERDVDDELRTHLELRVADLQQLGLTPAEARRQALDEFGDLETTRNGLYEIERRVSQQRARFLSTVVNGLMMERALPADGVRLDAETATLRLAVCAVLAAPAAEETP